MKTSSLVPLCARSFHVLRADFGEPVALGAGLQRRITIRLADRRALAPDLDHLIGEFAA